VGASEVEDATATITRSFRQSFVMQANCVGVAGNGVLSGLLAAYDVAVVRQGLPPDVSFISHLGASLRWFGMYETARQVAKAKMV
jgi:hypothetical protein